jgi:myo-inositol-1(or 4)-monophosphatase
MDKLLSLAVGAAKSAGSIHMKYLGKGMKVFAKGEDDIVTNADLDAEKEIIRRIRRSYPDHNILTEESEHVETRSEYRWIIDPVDGTANFAKRIPFFSVSIALQKSDKTVLGVIYNPALDEMFTARRGYGAYLNGKRIINHYTSKHLVDVLVCPFYDSVSKDRGMKIMRTLMDKNYEVRLLYGLAMELAYVACGRLDAGISLLADIYGSAAGKLLVEEAGGKIVGLNGKALDDAPWKGGKPIVAIGNDKIRDVILRAIR